LKLGGTQDHIALLDLVGFSNFLIEWMSLSTSKKILYFPLRVSYWWQFKIKCFSSSITILQNLQNLSEVGIFGLEYLPDVDNDIHSIRKLMNPTKSKSAIEICSFLIETFEINKFDS
jgi:hypothetical protein